MDYVSIWTLSAWGISYKQTRVPSLIARGNKSLVLSCITIHFFLFSSTLLPIFFPFYFSFYFHYCFCSFFFHFFFPSSIRKQEKEVELVSFTVSLCPVAAHYVHNTFVYERTKRGIFEKRKKKY